MSTTKTESNKHKKEKPVKKEDGSPSKQHQIINVNVGVKFQKLY